MLLPDNCMTVYENLPSKVKGFTIHNPIDDFYTIVLNYHHSYETHKSTFNHEIKHIINKDFSGYKDVNLLEAVMR